MRRERGCCAGDCAGFGQRQQWMAIWHSCWSRSKHCFYMECPVNVTWSRQCRWYMHVLYGRMIPAAVLPKPFLMGWSGNSLLQKNASAGYVYEEYAKEAVLYKDAVSYMGGTAGIWAWNDFTPAGCHAGILLLSILRTKQVDREWLKTVLIIYRNMRMSFIIRRRRSWCSAVWSRQVRRETPCRTGNACGAWSRKILHPLHEEAGKEGCHWGGLCNVWSASFRHIDPAWTSYWKGKTV